MFEQPELCQTLDSPSSYDDVTTSSVIGDVDVHEEEHPTQDVDLGTTESQPLLNEHVWILSFSNRLDEYARPPRTTGGKFSRYTSHHRCLHLLGLVYTVRKNRERTSVF